MCHMAGELQLADRWAAMQEQLQPLDPLDAAADDDDPEAPSCCKIPTACAASDANRIPDPCHIMADPRPLRASTSSRTAGLP